MTAAALRPVPRGVRARRRSAYWRKRASAADVISVAGAVGAPVLDPSGRRVGRIEDLVVDWKNGGGHPALAGVVVRGWSGRTYAPSEDVAELSAAVVRLRRRLERRPVEAHPSLVSLARDVLDRQVVDADGVDVGRISDLVIATGPPGIRLVGGDASARTLLRRLGPPSLRRRVAPARVHDWARVGPFSPSPDSVLQLLPS
jgi:sporulation protein YlmC with PRC-barrel domain